jgi:hypothetical protein
MSTIGSSVLTLVDWAKRRDPMGKTDKIIEALEEDNPILQDAVYVEGNLPTGHRTTIRTTLPSGAWRQVNAGVTTDKSETRQVTDAIGMLEAYSECDKFLADLSGDTAAFRWSEDQAFLSGMSNEFARVTFKGDTSDVPEEFEGLEQRYQTDSGCDYFIDGGGSGTDNRSMWLVTWGQDTCHLIFPKGSMAGIEADDKGQVTLGDSTNGYYEGYRTHYKLHVGLSLRDERYVVRCGNIDHSALTEGTDPGIMRLVVQMIRAVQSKKGRQVIYAPRSVVTWMDIFRAEGGGGAPSSRTHGNMGLTLGEWAGEPTTFIWGIPVRICDALEADEAHIA